MPAIQIHRCPSLLQRQTHHHSKYLSVFMIPLICEAAVSEIFYRIVIVKLNTTGTQRANALYISSYQSGINAGIWKPNQGKYGS